MAFSINDLQDLIALLAEKPEWRAQLRPLILGEEFDRLPKILQELAEAQRRTEAQLEQLVRNIDRLVERADRAETRLDAWDGFWTQSMFEKRARDYFGELVGRARVITPEEAGADDARDAGLISEAELRQLDALDLVIRGKSKSAPATDLVLAVEVSRTIDYNDVERAADLAAIFEKAGISAKGAVGGARIDERVRKFADDRSVFVKVVTAAEMPR